MPSPQPEAGHRRTPSAYAAGLRRGGARVEQLELRDLDFDLDLHFGFSDRQPLEPDLRYAQQLIEQAVHVAWFFPTWWAGPPARLKGFIDRTFLPGWAFANRPDRPLPDTLLRGRSSRVVTTMDSPSFWYQLWHRASVHASFVNATLRYVGFGPISSTTLYSQMTRTPAQRAAWIERLDLLGERDAKATKGRNLGPRPLGAASSVSAR